MENSAKLFDRKTITTETYEVIINDKKYHFIDYLDEKSKAIDSVLRDENGDDINDPILMETAQNLVDALL